MGQYTFSVIYEYDSGIYTMHARDVEHGHITYGTDVAKGIVDGNTGPWLGGGGWAN